jgi:hypothetical protein
MSGSELTIHLPWRINSGTTSFSYAEFVANWQTTLFINHHGIATVNDMNLLEPHQAKDLVKQFSFVEYVNAREVCSV